MPVRPRLRHRFDVGFAEARAIQERLRDRVERADRLGPVRTVAGVDVSYDRGSPILYGAVVVLDAASGEVVHQVAMGDEDDDLIRSSVVVAHGDVLIRTNRKLFCVGR